MPRGNPSPKLAITIDPAIHEGIMAAAAREGVSVSAWMTDAAREAWRKEPIVAPIVGGSGPMAHFTGILKVPVVSVGCSYPGSRKHAPDEHVRIDDFANGAKLVARILAAFATQGSTEQSAG